MDCIQYVSGEKIITMPKTKQRKQKDGSPSNEANEREGMSPVDVEEFHTDILDAGTELASLLELEFPNAESVSNALFDVVKVVEDYELRETWITACTGGTKDDLVTTSKIGKVSNVLVNVKLCVFLFLIIAL